MNQAMSHADHGRPRNSGALVARLWADLASGLTHNLKSVNEREGQHLVAVEVFAAPALRQRIAELRAVDDAVQPNSVLRLHTAAPPYGRPRRGNTGSAPRQCASLPFVP